MATLETQLGLKGMHLTVMQRKTLRYMAEACILNKPLTWHDAMIKAGYGKNSANIPSQRIPMEVFDTILHNAGLSNEKLAKTYNNAIEAKKPVICNKEMIMVDDHNVRLKAAELVSKMRGYMKDDDDGSKSKGGTVVNILIANKDKQESMKIGAVDVKCSEQGQGSIVQINTTTE